MSWIVSLGVAVLTAAFGLFVAGTVGSLIVDWYNVSSFEGGSGYLIIALALLGGMAGFVLGLVVSRVVAARGGRFLAACGAAFGTVLLLGLVSAGTARLLADVPPEIDGQTLFLSVELQWPAGEAPSAALRSQPGTVTLGALRGSTVRARQDGPLFTSRAFQSEGRWTMPGEVHVFTGRGGRLVMFEIGETRLPAFSLPLPGRPGAGERQWSRWLPVEDDARVAKGFRYRFRVRLESEAMRTDVVGPFTIETRPTYYFRVDNEEGFAARSVFGVRFRDTLVAEVEPASAVAVVGGPVPALVVTGGDQDGVCKLIREVDGRPAITEIGPCTLQGDGIHPLTSNQETFVAAQRHPVAGWIDTRTLAEPGLYQISQSILDTRTFTSTRFIYLSNYSPYGSIPPVALSPDERSFAILTTDIEHDRAALVVIPRDERAAYPVAIDRARMRFNTENDIGPAWVAHHFVWQPADGGERLVERPGFAPLPHKGELTLGAKGDYQSYTLRPGAKPLREAVLKLLVERLGGERLSDPPDAYSQRVRLDGRELSVSAGEDPSYVTVSMDSPNGDPEFMRRIGGQLDALIATGQLDDLFVEPPKPAGQ